MEENNMDKEKLDRLWEKFSKDIQYVTLDGKIPLKTIMVDFASFVLKHEYNL